MIENNAKILCVDDTRVFRKILERMLSEAGYMFVGASDGDEAINVAEKENPDLILMDVNMPKMNGFAAASEIRSNPNSSQIPILFLTTSDTIEDKREAFQLGADDFITKPFDKDELLARIKRRLDRRVEEKRQESKARVETLSQLMITLAHHINNALAVMSGRVELCDPENADEVRELKFQLNEQIHRIGSVVESIVEMANSEEISTAPYISSSGAMLDIARQLESKLKQG